MTSKVALITGAGRGLGRILATFLGGLDYDLVITSRTRAELEDTAKSIRVTTSRRVSAIPGDVNEPRHRDELLEVALRMGGLTLLVNNASDLGETPRPELGTASLKRFRQSLETNLVTPLALIQEAIPQLRQTHGMIVNITSDASQVGYERWGVYGAGKAGLDLLSKTLAAELKPWGISVVAVDPGDMRTRMHQDAFPGEDITDRPLPEVTLPFWAWLLNQNPDRVNGMRYQAQGKLWEIPALA